MTVTAAIPDEFHYREVYLRGKPRHDRFDSFRIKHPCMDVGHRAKIFAPFDALKGFGEAISSKNATYTDRIELEYEDQQDLGRKLSVLHNLTFNQRMARMNRVQIAVTYYVPCEDPNHEAYGFRGSYQTIRGVCWNVDTDVSKTILVGTARITITDIIKIESPSGIFNQSWSE